MVVNNKIMEELYTQTGKEKTAEAREYAKNKKINITKVLYDNSENFEIRSKVIANNEEIYDTYVQVENGEIKDVSCTCKDYLSLIHI